MASSVARRVALAFCVAACTACASRGRELFVREGCVSCHAVRGLGGGPGPDLTHVAARASAAEIRLQITNPTARNAASRMPAFPRLSRFDVECLVAFLRG